MSYQTVFKRYELKYLLTTSQKERILEAMAPHMRPDSYGKTTVRNLYLDTDNYRIIRRSIEKPAYKEKLRIRSYAQAAPDSTVFVELKKKYEKLVYKRRFTANESEAMSWVCGGGKAPRDTQISREIDYFLRLYGALYPTVFLSYDREAYFDKARGDFRVTFDENLLARRENVSLTAPIYGAPLLNEATVLMEIKCSGGIPLWMAGVLSEERIYKTAFSKYGRAYELLLFPEACEKIITDKKENLIYE